MAFLAELKQRSRRLKAETFALYLAARDPRTPWYAKLLVAGIVAYAFSPIDLIPDFVPVLGYLDDLILIPVGIALAMKLVPHSVLAECRARAHETMQKGKPVCQIAGVIIIVIWLLLAGLCIVWGYEAFMGQLNTNLSIHWEN
ncbi:MAG: YkvA family protein [Candidatus Scalindua sp.]|nr:YkvA family protein [Candidatus Scalindua sp.]